MDTDKLSAGRLKNGVKRSTRVMVLVRALSSIHEVASKLKLGEGGKRSFLHGIRMSVTIIESM